MTDNNRAGQMLVEFKRDLNRLHESDEIALPDTVPFKQFRNAAVIAVTDNPGILRCSKESVFKAVRTLAAMGLVPDGREAAIVPFKGQAQAMPMVAGLVKVARNSGKISSLWAEVVYEGETLRVWVEDGLRKWEHTKDDGTEVDYLNRGGEIRGAYAVAKLSDGTVEFEPMGRDKIEKRRRASANQKGKDPSGIWEQWEEEMACKTVIRYLCKRLPMSSDDMERILMEQEPLLPKDITPDSGQEQPRRNLAQHLTGEIEGPESTNTEGSNEDVPDAEVVPDFVPDPDSEFYGQGVEAFDADFNRDQAPRELSGDDLLNWFAGYDETKEKAGDAGPG